VLARDMEEQGRDLGVPVERMEGGRDDIPLSARRRYRRGSATAVMNYWVMFNSNPVIDSADLLIIDDAHLAAFESMADGAAGTTDPLRYPSVTIRPRSPSARGLNRPARLGREYRSRCGVARSSIDSIGIQDERRRFRRESVDARSQRTAAVPPRHRAVHRGLDGRGGSEIQPQRLELDTGPARRLRHEHEGLQRQVEEADRSRTKRADGPRRLPDVDLRPAERGEDRRDPLEHVLRRRVEHPGVSGPDRLGNTMIMPSTKCAPLVVSRSATS
jgi:hypothetical protein